MYPEEYLEYLPDTLVKKGEDISLTKEEGALRIFTHLNYGDTKEIRYSMRIKDNANGKELNNVVSTTELLGDAVGSTANKTIKVNDPKIDIQKSVDKLEYKVGDVVTYTVKIKSLVPGTTITNVNIKEVIPKGLDLKEDSGKISINRYRNSKWSCQNSRRW